MLGDLMDLLSNLVRFTHTEDRWIWEVTNGGIFLLSWLMSCYSRFLLQLIRGCQLILLCLINNGWEMLRQRWRLFHGASSLIGSHLRKTYSGGGLIITKTLPHVVSTRYSTVSKSLSHLNHVSKF